MSELDKLQQLGLISKVCAELDNHLGFSDKTLAEYIIMLAKQHSNDPKSFHKALLDNGAEFPESFTENLMRIIMRLTGQALVVKAKELANVPAFIPRNEADARYPGLARPNSDPIPLEDMAHESVISLVPEKWKEKPKEQPKELAQSQVRVMVRVSRISVLYILLRIRLHLPLTLTLTLTHSLRKRASGVEILIDEREER
jgi:ATP-dependent RNA helicase DHX8/PRP22